MAYLRATFLRVHLYFKTSFLVSQKEEQDSKPAYQFEVVKSF